MGDDTTYKINLEDTVTVNIDQLNLDLGDTITYDVTSTGGGTSGVSYCLLYTSPSPRDVEESAMASSA